MELKPNQIQAAICLASGMSCKDAATQAGVTPETLSHWKKNPYFEAILNEIRQENIDQARERLRSLARKAVDNLETLLEGCKSESVKLKACIEIIKLSNISEPKFYGWGIGETTPERLMVSKAFNF